MARGFTVLRVRASEDLLPFLVLLQQRRVPHRVYEAGGEQVLEVADPAQVEGVKNLYHAWRSGELLLEIRKRWQRSRVPACSSGCGLCR